MSRHIPGIQRYISILAFYWPGVTFDLTVPKLLMGAGSPKPNIEQLILDLDSSVQQDWEEENMAHSLDS
jgi:hypothetical protein